MLLFAHSNRATSPTVTSSARTVGGPHQRPNAATPDAMFSPRSNSTGCVEVTVSVNTSLKRTIVE